MRGYLRSWVTYILLYPIKRRRMERLFSQLDLVGMGLVFDIGSHLGDKSQFFLDYGIRTVAVEPQPDFAQRLRNRLGHKPEFIVVEQAVASSPGRMQLQISSQYPTVSTLDHRLLELAKVAPGWRQVVWDQQLEVEVTTLDYLIQQYGRPDFVKIDVEGFELQVLQGLTIPLPLLSFEYLPIHEEPAQACIYRLEQLARYNYAFSAGERFILNTPWLMAEEMMDYLNKEGKSGDIYAKILS